MWFRWVGRPVWVHFGFGFNAGGPEGQSFKGVLMLLCYSLGLGIPFILSAVLLQNLKSVFGIIKRNYRIINLVFGPVSGLLLEF